MKVKDNAATGDGPGADTNSILASDVGFLKGGYKVMMSKAGAASPVQCRSRIGLCKMVLKARGVLASVKEQANEDVVKRSLKKDIAEFEEESE